MLATVQSLLLLLEKERRGDTVGNPYTRSVFHRLKNCRTHAGGYRKLQCDNQECNENHFLYNSCGNRHCPQCGAARTLDWIQQRSMEVLPCNYYHVVFTLPHELNSLVMGNRTVLLDLLMQSSKYALMKLSSDEQWLGGSPAIISVLHTWGQTLSFHPHVHCIVSDGGVDKSGQWKNSKRTSGKFLFPIRMLQQIYRGYFLQQLYDLIKLKKIKTEGINIKELFGNLKSKSWVIDVRPTMKDPAQVLEYLGRYTRKVAISNHRIKRLEEDGTIHFQFKDYSDKGRKKMIRLSGEEFLRRFEQHILPKGFVKVRFSGCWCNRNKSERPSAIRKQLKLSPLRPSVKHTAQVLLSEHYGNDITLCKKCKQGHMVVIASVFAGQIRDGPLENTDQWKKL